MNDLPGVSIIPFGGKAPVIHPSAFIAPGCRIIGDVEIGPDTSIWYNCVIRADVNHIRIGARTNIQDGTIVHCESARDGKAGFATIIGDDVLIGHLAMVHGCTLMDRAFVGLGTIVMDGCTVEGDAMLAAGAMLTPGKHVASGELWAGRPAALMRQLTDAQLADMRSGVIHYVKNAKAHRAAIAGI